MIKVVPFFGGSFTSVFPWFIFVIALCTLLHVWGVLARMLNIQRFQYVVRIQPGNERHQDMMETIEEGKKLIELSIRNDLRMKEQMVINVHNQADPDMLV